MHSVAPSYVENVVAEGVPARSPGGPEVDFSAEKRGGDLGNVFGALRKHPPTLWGRRFNQNWFLQRSAKPFPDSDRAKVHFWDRGVGACARPQGGGGASRGGSSIAGRLECIAGGVEADVWRRPRGAPFVCSVLKV